MLIGVWVLLLAAPGFPPVWKATLLILTGVGIVVFAYRMKPGSPEQKPRQRDLPFTDYKRSEDVSAPVMPTTPTAAPEQPIPHDEPVA